MINIDKGQNRKDIPFGDSGKVVGNITRAPISYPNSFVRTVTSEGASLRPQRSLYVNYRSVMYILTCTHIYFIAS